MAKNLDGQRGKRKAKNGRGKRKTAEVVQLDSARTASPEQSALNLPQRRDLKHHYDTLKGSLARLAEAQAHHRNFVKAAQEAGCDTKAILDQLRAEKKDPLAITLYFRQRAILMQETGYPIQLSLYEPKYGSAVEQAKVEGYAAGKEGEKSSSRFPEGSPEDEAYKAAWTQGQADLMKGGSDAHV